MPAQVDRETVDARGAGARSSAAGERLYLLVLERSSAVVHPLPASGTVLIGRAVEAGIVVQDPSVSRQHAQVVVGQDEARIFDLDSHNGVLINGERVEGSQALQSGDVLALGDITLVFHRGDQPCHARPLLGPADLRDRLSAELERVVGYERELGVLAVDPGPQGPSSVELLRACDLELRLMDFAGHLGGCLAIVLPELGAEEATGAARHLMEAIAEAAPEARAGFAAAPRDGVTAEALLAAVRAAALGGAPGRLQVGPPDSHRLHLGERSAIVADPAMVHTFELLRRLAASDIPVLIHGETGVGKENAAWAVHHWSERSQRPFVAINCASLPESLAESELFGHDRGAFSGADRARAGWFEEAGGGTLFLDEVADLSPAVQAKLLRALELKVIRRLGEAREREVDVRVVAATHRILADEVKALRFREDLYFRLAAAVVVLPPLRDRPLELALLARTFLAQACARLGRAPLALSAAASAVLAGHSWPGNVRELRNVMEYVVAVARNPVVEPSDLPSLGLDGGPVPPAVPVQDDGPRGQEAPRALAEEIRALERRRMAEALEKSGGVQTAAARLIGMADRTFRFKLKQYGL